VSYTLRSTQRRKSETAIFSSCWQLMILSPDFTQTRRWRHTRPYGAICKYIGACG
jgi:hypothetical protein